MFSVIYITCLILLALYGCHQQHKTSRMWQAIQKPTHTDEIRWTPLQRKALMTATPAEAEQLKAACAAYDGLIERKKPPFGG